MRRLIHNILKMVNRVTGYSIWGRDNVPEISRGGENLERFDLEGYKL